MRAAVVWLLAGQFLAGQVPRISLVDFYGLRRVSEYRARQALAVKEGDPLPPSKAAVEERLEGLDGVVLARVEAVCCEADGAMLFVGVEEKGAPHFEVRAAPASSSVLSEALVEKYGAFLELYERSARPGQDSESLARGYALSSIPEVRAYQESFVELAEAEAASLREVLRESAEPEHRAIAAYLTGYAPDRRSAVETLQYALQDPEATVRHTALRALAAIAVFASRNPDAGLRIAPTWPVEMLNSLILGDRTQAAEFLVLLTENRDAAILDRIRERALDSIVEMARWKSLRYALPAYVLLGRMAGLPESQIEETWSKGGREDVISKAVPKLRRRD
ncbi:MAG: HEAT repeat domain-containing protein [Bryobacterales bacterium]|nr:HEAT repeat domain-containing protein [Bryobacterales bacterium]